MSAKWRALQHKHRYTYSAVIFPQHFMDCLNSLPPEISSLKFYEELKQLVSLNSTYSQVNYVKNVASAFANLLLDGEESVVSQAARFYLEILFLENSLPLHKTLISVLAKNRNFHSLVSECFRSLCDMYSGAEGKEKRFCLSRVSLSLMSSPKLGYLVGIVEECAVLVAWDIVRGLSGVVSEIKDWSRLSPVVMEQCQEALSCMYYLLQRFPSKFAHSDDLTTLDSNVLPMVIELLLKVLKLSIFSRDCFVAAGVGLCAALQVCLTPPELNIFIMECILNQATCNSSAGVKMVHEEVIRKVPYKGNLLSELNRFSVLSRLCLIRGILTAVSRNVLNTELLLTNNASDSHDNNGKSVQTILCNGILPELCNYCENPLDSHFNFHSLTVMQICLQQIKASMQANLVPRDYDPIPEDMGTRILKIIWNNLEDPLSQTVKQVHLIFDIFLDVQTDLRWTQGSDNIKSFLKKIAFDLLRLGPRCKGRYVPLSSLTRRLGAKTILEMCPDLLYQTTQSYIDDDICCAATSFLKCFLECLRDEYWSSEGIEEGYISLRRHCLPPVLFGLAAGASKLRTNLNTYTLPVLLEVDVDCIFPMLSFVSVGTDNKEQELYPELNHAAMSLTVEQKVAILVSLLKVSRSLALMEGDIDLCDSFSKPNNDHRNDLNAFICIKGIRFLVPVEWLVLALTHVDDSLRVDAAETLFLNPKTSSVPSSLELRLMKAAIPLNMRCCSTGFQMKWTSLFRKFFSRVRTALERQVKQCGWKPFVLLNNNKLSSNNTVERSASSADDLFHFMKWFSSVLFFSCYPSAPYERKIMAMELMLIMIDVWSIIPTSREIHVSTPECILYPYNEGITLPSSTLLLVGSIVDSWDRLRENSFRILLQFPIPLPGISSHVTVQELMKWAKQLVISPRVRESDAGALTLRLVFRKYVLDLGWTVRPSDTVVCVPSHVETVNGNFKDSKSEFPMIDYINSMIAWLNIVVEEGEKDLSEACKNSFVHGVLLALRYTFEEIDWNSDVVLSSVLEMRRALEKLLELIMRITTLALWVVSSDAWYLPDDMDEIAEDDTFLVETPETNGPKSSSEREINSSDPIQDAKPSDQTVMVGCWLAMKEVSLLLGTIIRKIPLPTGTFLDPSSSDDHSLVSADHVVMLDLQQLETIGNHFLEVLLKMKHNGAIDKTRAGFTALCNRLLCSNDPKLCKLTELWMEQLMQRTIAKGQVVDDLLRRSAGIPAAFIALFLSEPEGTPKKLLPRALRWLLDVVSRSLSLSEANSSDLPSHDTQSPKPEKLTMSMLPSKLPSNGTISKIRDEGVVPTVHAFNVLRAAFNDANLATDTSSFAAEAIILSIRSFSSSYWEIRNSACLAYTALVKRMVGFLNVQKRESARRSITGLEFFHRYTFNQYEVIDIRERYPSLHPFLINELKVATEFLRDGASSQPDFSLANGVHPSLCPMLILLSRLKPSTISSEIGDPLDPFAFLPFIRSCSNQSNLKVRVLASRALTGLVSNEKLPVVLLSIVSELPCMEDQATVPSVRPSYNSIHGALLQLSSLLENNCRYLVDSRRKDQIMGDLIESLSARGWIGRPKCYPCPILNVSLLKVLELILAILKTCGNSKHLCSVRSLLMELSSACLDVEACGYSYYDPTVAELCKQATTSYFSCVFQGYAKVDSGLRIQIPSSKMLIHEPKESFTSLNRVQDKLILLMSDPIYEVRLATLKWLYSFLLVTDSHDKTSELVNGEMEPFYRWAQSGMQPTLLKILDDEKYHKCVYYILRILFIWNLQQFRELEYHSSAESSHVGVMGIDSVFTLWNKLTSMYKITRHVKVREILICCMGVSIKRISGLYAEAILLNEKHVPDELRTSSNLTRQTQSLECMVYLVKLIKRHSVPSEPTTVRRAAAKSLIASGLLEQAELIGSYVHNVLVSCGTSSPDFKSVETADVYAREIMTLWFIGIKLLEDEDLELRQNLAVQIQRVISLRVSKGVSQTGVVPTQVEKVIELSFEYLSSVFGHWVEYLDYLLHSVLDAANYVALEGDLVRRVFDKEIDNHHEEKLLISQICCSHLEKLPILQSWEASSTDKHAVSLYLHSWRTKFLNQLISIAKYHSERLGSVGWIGGIGNHKDAFLPLYANLLGYYALSKCITDGKYTGTEFMASQVIDLKDTLSDFIGNPMISNLYVMIVKLHEESEPSGGLTLHKQIEDCSLWEDFDPYFLLR
ncbi:unnamed protein product [Rhodiola kirilowii]